MGPPMADDIHTRLPALVRSVKERQFGFAVNFNAGRAPEDPAQARFEIFIFLDCSAG